MLRILHVTDLHCHKPFYEWVSELADQYDVVCISGDLIGDGTALLHDENKQAQQDFVIQWLEKMTKPIFVCSGNHDVITDDENDLHFNLDDFDSSIDDANTWEIDEEPVDIPRCTWLNGFRNENVYADNTIHTIKGITFGVVPYNYNDSLSKFKHCDVLLHHEPPATTPTAIQNELDWGNSELYQALKNNIISPDYILSGHVHHPDSTSSKVNKTVIYNPGADFTRNTPRHRILVL